MKTACFSGNRIHRMPFIFDEQNEECTIIKHRLEAEIKKAIARGYTYFISKMDLGIDMWAAEIVLRIKKFYPEITLEAAIPHENQASYWTESQRERYFDILSECDYVTYLSTRFIPSSIELANTYMINKGSLLIAVYDGKDEETNAAINHAKAKGLELVLIDLY